MAKIAPELVLGSPRTDRLNSWLEVSERLSLPAYRLRVRLLPAVPPTGTVQVGQPRTISGVLMRVLMSFSLTRSYAP
jgi:hypothetical protein